MLMWFFGKPVSKFVHISEPDKIGGFLELENADVTWYLSLDSNDLPENVKERGQTTFRSITIDGREVEFSGGFTDLHTKVYEETLNGRGFGIEHARPSIELVHELRQAPVTAKGERHPILDT
jgi:UDP-N-acetyl-2-amino-2-deoxyglucuronate dehydrogenase